MKHFIRLIRPNNLLIIAATMYSLAWYFDTIFLQSGKDTLIQSFDFFLLVLSTVFIAAAGNIINDYFDIKADRINRPDKIIITKHIKRRWAIFLHWTINFIAFVIAGYLSYRNETFWYLFIHLLSINLLWYYSMQLKRTLVTGNIIIGILTGLVPLLVGIFYNQHTEYGELILTFPFDLAENDQFPVYVSAGLGLFAFLLNWTREIIKDIEDIEGDKILKARTIPIVWGVKKAKNIAVILMITTVVLSLLLLVFRNLIVDLAALLPLVLSAFSILVSLFLLIRAQEKKHFRASHSWVKITMVFGLILPIYWAIMLNYL
ncbi:MAG: geranylgeranylglycerol-phosphate geranylgeranyltransferase [Brumimicrobium sp.]|nr:geranylgeranylglycerol-phosphate geranylgeranyltransferase [Brumimicrobium sp.]